jgi:hypothetical protein
MAIAYAMYSASEEVDRIPVAARTNVWVSLSESWGLQTNPKVAGYVRLPNLFSFFKRERRLHWKWSAVGPLDS